LQNCIAGPVRETAKTKSAGILAMDSSTYIAERA
jgi:hypothetical protein